MTTYKRSFFSMVCAVAMALITPIAAGLTRGLASAFEFLTGFTRATPDFRNMNSNPRSIFETRRMGLA